MKEIVGHCKKCGSAILNPFEWMSSWNPYLEWTCDCFKKEKRKKSKQLPKCE